MTFASRPLSDLGNAIQTVVRLFQDTEAYDKSPLDGTSLKDRDPMAIEQLMPVLDWFYQHYFPVDTQGLETIPEGPFLMVGSHNGGLGAPDMFMLMNAWFQRFGPEPRVYGLMNAKMWTGYPALARLAARVGAVQATPKLAIAALRSGGSVLVYPGGARDVYRHYSLRHQIFLNGNLAFIKLALREQVPIVPVVSVGAHDTLKVMGDLYPLLKRLHAKGMPWLLGIDPEVWPVFLGMPWGLGVGPLLNIPWARPIHLRVGEPIELGGNAASAKDVNFVMRCYDKVHAHMQMHLNHLVAQYPAESLTF